MTLIGQNLSSSANWSRDIQLYARLVFYEMIALVPAILLVVPIETCVLHSPVVANKPDLDYSTGGRDSRATNQSFAVSVIGLSVKTLPPSLMAPLSVLSRGTTVFRRFPHALTCRAG